MSDDTLNVDSVEELPTEETIGTDEAASQETTDDSVDEALPKGKEKALRDTEAALKEKQAEFTRMSQQLAEMKGTMNALMQMQAQKNQPEVKDWMEEYTDDKVIENPALALKALANMRKEFVSVLRDRDEWMKSEIEKARGSSIDPSLQAVVNELRSDPDFADLPDNKLVAMAKKMGTPKKAVMSPRGNIASGQRGAPAPKALKPGELTPEQEAYLRAAGIMRDKKRDDTLE